jgi:N-acetyl-alpha-D-glucosaminyl L-malate synthase BshA
MQPLSIAMVCYPALGGSGVVASELARGLAARGHRVHVIATTMPDRAGGGGEGGAGDVRFERVDVPSSPVFEHGPYCLAVASKIVELVRREPIDVLHVHYAVPHAASALLAAQVLGDAAPPLVMTLHGTDATRLAEHPGVHPVTSFAIAAAGAITVPSHFLRREAAERYGLPAARIQVIPNFVDLERFAPAPRPAAGARPAAAGPLLFHVSNFRPIKRPADLAEVLARVRREVPARMVLVGDGPERAAVEARAAELGISDAMTFLGRRSDFAGQLAEADAFVLTSESESFGVAALEAMAAGVPVYGYRVGGLPEVVCDDAGVLVPLGDLDALAAAILEGLRGPARSDARDARDARDAMGRAARRCAEHEFSAPRALASYEAIYRRLSAGQTRSRGAAR